MNWYLRTILAGLPIQALDRFKVTDPEVRAFLSREETDAKLYVGAIKKNPNITLEELQGNLKTKEKGKTKEEHALKDKYTQEEVDWANEMSQKLSDPSLFSWLLNQTRNGSANIQTGEDDIKIFRALSKFKQFKDRKQFKKPEKGEKDDGDIRNYKDFSDLSDFLKKIEGDKISVNKDLISSIDGASMAYAEGDISIVKVDTFEAGNQLFTDGWCVKDDEEFFYKTYGTPYYMWSKNGNPYALYSEPSGDFMDEHDNRMSTAKSVPLVESFEHVRDNNLFKLGSDMNVILEQKKRINYDISTGDMDNLERYVRINPETASLIDSFHLNREIIDMVKSAYIDAAKVEEEAILDDNRANFEGLMEFYDGVPKYVDIRSLISEPIEEFVSLELESYPKSWNNFNKAFKTKERKDFMLNHFSGSLRKEPGMDKDYIPTDLKNSPELLNAEKEGWLSHLYLQRITASSEEIERLNLDKDVNISGSSSYFIPIAYWGNVSNALKDDEDMLGTFKYGFYSAVQGDPKWWSMVPDVFKEQDAFQEVRKESLDNKMSDDSNDEILEIPSDLEGDDLVYQSYIGGIAKKIEKFPLVYNKILDYDQKNPEVVEARIRGWNHILDRDGISTLQTGSSRRSKRSKESKWDFEQSNMANTSKLVYEHLPQEFHEDPRAKYFDMMRMVVNMDYAPDMYGGSEEFPQQYYQNQEFLNSWAERWVGNGRSMAEDANISFSPSTPPQAIANNPIVINYLSEFSENAPVQSGWYGRIRY